MTAEQAAAIAQPNIALIKYWGKRDVAKNLPAVGSISITLGDLQTRMQLNAGSGENDSLVINGEPNVAMLPRISTCLDTVLGTSRAAADVISEANFPIAAGLASSASAFAALVVAANRLSHSERSTAALSQLAGAASGSAARSLYGGFVELSNNDDNITTRCLLPAGQWPLKVVVAVTATGPKAVGSTRAMEISRKSSPFYSRWVASQDDDLCIARQAVVDRDFAQLAAVAEHNCLKMHSVMWASRPPMVYWNSATLACLETVRRLQSDGVSVFFTIDAGPQVKAVCLPEDCDRVSAALAATAGVMQIMQTGLGEGARLVDRVA